MVNMTAEGNLNPSILPFPQTSKYPPKAAHLPVGSIRLWLEKIKWLMLPVITVCILTSKLHSRKTSNLTTIPDAGTRDEWYALPLIPLIPHLPAEIKGSNL